jgi:hypothetical protein
VRAAAAITAAARFDPLPLAHSNRSQVTLFVRLKDLRLTGRALQRLVRIAGPDRIAHGWVPTALRRCHRTAGHIHPVLRFAADVCTVGGL